MDRVYRIRRIGNAYALTIPKILVTEAMLDRGVRIQVLDYSPDEMILKVSVADERRKHDPDSEASGADTQEPWPTDSLRQDS
jgi:antitoxin component of MazEF toxin-antitoxin module